MVQMEKNNETFEYTYSAAQQEEIKRIRAKYLPQENNKLEQLRKLDASVTQKATMVGIIVGIIGCLTFGGGLSIILAADIKFFVLGIVIGIVGMILMGIAYPVYKKIVEKERIRIAPQILALTDELSI